MDTAPPEVRVDNEFESAVLSRAITLSPLREQAWFMAANIPLRQAGTLPARSVDREKYYRDAISVLEICAEKEPTLPASRFILATLYYALGDAAAAKRLADEALELYTDTDIVAAKPAVKYYIAISDWTNAARFLSDIYADNPSDYTVMYDLAKVKFLAGDREASLQIVNDLRSKNPEILGTDQNFMNAITNYEQSK